MLIEQTTDLWSFNTGRVQAKLWVNEKPFPEKTIVSFVLLDNSHLTEHGIKYFCALSKEFVLIGGKDTSTLIDGTSLLKQEELNSLGVLKLEECTVLGDSYIRIRYKVIS